MTAPAIRTPDQRLRVFVSSTLNELAAERRAAREGIERLRLSPVMFEVAARAHPPRNLYRAYLAQSDVFVGIYSCAYGWVAPGMDISGLEDEYLLSRGMPRLVYVKRAADREPRLVRMLERIESDDLSYRPFTEATELAELVANDLALVLTERFAAAEAGAPVTDAAPLYLPPVENGVLIGRETLVDDVSRRLDDSRLVTLTGPGGTGKTCLAIHLANTVADRFPDGVYYVPLAAVRDAREVAQTLASTLELPIPQGGADPLRLVTGFLRTKKALLVLDNFEQVIEAAPDVATLLAVCKNLVVLVTSRTPLRVRGEREVLVPPLTLGRDAAAVRLFEMRAQAVRPSFAVTDENRAAVTEICRRLDGLPLAIELAAARTRVLTPQSMLPRLDKSLALLTGGAKDLPARHQTLRAALAWSFDLLSEAERAAIRRLAVFTGTFGLEAAEAVTNAEGDALDLLGSLVDQSLVVRTEVFDEPRFHLLETVREFALDALESAGETRATRTRHANWARSFVSVSRSTLSDFQSEQPFERFLVDEGHVRSALGWCLGRDGDVELGWHILSYYLEILQTRMRIRDVIAWFDRATRAGPCTDELARLKAQTARGSAAWSTGDVETARAFLEGTAERLRSLGDMHVAGWAELGWVQTRVLSGDLTSLGDLDRAIDDFRRGGDAHGEAYARSLQAFAALRMGDIARARALTLAAIDFATEHRDNEFLTFLASILGRISLAEGDMDRAREVFANAVAVGREKGALWGRIDALMLLASVVLAQGDRSAAQGILEEAVHAGRTVGLGFGLELVVGALAGLAAREGDLEHAAALLQLLPDAYEDNLDDRWRVTGDPVGSLREEIRNARRLLGARARTAPDRDAIYDEVLDLAIRRAAHRVER